MGRIIFIYGAIGGIVVAAGTWIGMSSQPDGGGAWGMVVGYLTMLIALSTVFVGVKQYRDVHGGGVIRFWPAFGVGLAIAGIASLFYILTWEAYLWNTDYAFVNTYFDGEVEKLRASGASADKVAAYAKEMADFKASYANPLFRMPMTLVEIAPVGLLVALVSAGVLRNSKAFPATT